MISFTFIILWLLLLYSSWLRSGLEKSGIGIPPRGQGFKFLASFLPYMEWCLICRQDCTGVKWLMTEQYRIWGKQHCQIVDKSLVVKYGLGPLRDSQCKAAFSMSMAIQKVSTTGETYNYTQGSWVMITSVAWVLLQCSMYEGAIGACRELSRSSIAQISLTEAATANATAELERANLLTGEMSIKMVVWQWFFRGRLAASWHKIFLCIQGEAVNDLIVDKILPSSQSSNKMAW